MNRYEGLKRKRTPNCQGLIDNILGKGTPDRVYHMELFLDVEVRDALAERFGLIADIDAGDPDFDYKKFIAVSRFCGFDFVRTELVANMPLHSITAKDTASLAKPDGRNFMDEHKGPVTSWEEFEKFAWPDPNAPSVTKNFEWYQKNLPDDMCMIATGNFAHFAEYLNWLMGYETLCFALYEQRDLVEAIVEKITKFFRICLERVLQFDRVKIVWGSDDMGFKTSLMFSPDDMRKFVLPGHKLMAEMSHKAGRPYLLHSCGKLSEIMDDLVDDVKIDAKHSFEDTIEDVCEAKNTYGRRIAMIGGIDIDFLCRSDEQAIRNRIRKTLDICMPGGRFCLGTGNSVANYIPLDNYLTMLDEGMLYGA